MKSEIFQWILRNGEAYSKSDVKQFVPIIINLLSDKSKEIKQ